MKLPNFIIVGCGKAGTSSLYEYLCLHPDIFMSENKEPRYFAEPEIRPNFRGPLDEVRYNATTVWKWDDYCELFRDADGYSAVGEASPMYMTSKQIPKNIKQRLGEIKLIVLLRSPVEIAYSAYSHQVRDGFENLKFEEALLAENERIKKHWAWHWRYTSMSTVVPEVLAEYYKEFKRENIKIIFYDDFKRDNFGVVKDVFKFLEVDPEVDLIPNRSNEGGLPRFPRLYKLITRPSVFRTTVIKPAKLIFTVLRVNGVVRSIAQNILSKRVNATIPAQVHDELCDLFQKTVNDISRIVGVDLTQWLIKNGHSK